MPDPEPTPTPYPWEEGGELPAESTPTPDQGPVLVIPPSAPAEGQDMTREELRSYLRFYTGLDLPVTTEDLYNVANQLRTLNTWMGTLEGTPFANLPGVQGLLGGAGTAAVRRLVTYGEEYFGRLAGGGDRGGVLRGSVEAGQYRAAFDIFDELLRPARPSIEQVPTPEEFLRDFNTSFDVTIEGMRLTSARLARGDTINNPNLLSQDEINFAQSVMRPELLNQYLGELGRFAEHGISPFTLSEVDLAARGLAPGSEAQQAMEAAVGPGVKEPTRIREELRAEQVVPPKVIPPEVIPPGEDIASMRARADRAVGEEKVRAEEALARAQEWQAQQEDLQRRASDLGAYAQAVGTGTPREFQAIPRLMPLDFLRRQLTTQQIKTAYAGSAQGAQRYQAGQAPAGFVSSPRRV